MILSNPTLLTPRQHHCPSNNERRFEIGKSFDVLMSTTADGEGGFVCLMLELAASPPLSEWSTPRIGGRTSREVTVELSGGTKVKVSSVGIKYFNKSLFLFGSHINILSCHVHLREEVEPCGGSTQGQLLNKKHTTINHRRLERSIQPAAFDLHSNM